VACTFTKKNEEWLNGTTSDSTGYTRVDTMYDEPRLNLFRKFFAKEVDEKPPLESLHDKVLKEYVKKSFSPRM
jgi:hypothetical protein